MKEIETRSVAIVTPYYRTTEREEGGVGSHYAELAEGLAARGIKVLVLYVTGREVSEAVKHIGEPNLVVERIADRPDWSRLRIPLLSRLGAKLEKRTSYGRFLKIYQNARVLFALRRARRTQGIQLVETTNYQYMCLLYTFLPGHLPVCTRVSTTIAQVKQNSPSEQSKSRGFIEYLESLMIRRSTSKVTHTHAHAHVLAEEISIPYKSFEIIAHGISLPPLSELEETESGGHGTRILFVGWLSERKGIDVLLESIPAVLDRFSDVEFRLAGRDDNDRYRKAFGQRWKDRYTSRVKFLGSIDAATLRREYLACDMVAVPSRYESFGLVYVEAMGYMKPSIATTAGGIPEVIDDGKTGLLVEPGDTEGLIEKLTDLIADPEKRRRLGEAGRKAAESRFSRESMIDSTIALYNRLLSEIA